MKTSVVVVTYNEEENIKECLNSLMGQSRESDEIILVDDGSKDRTVEFASSYPIKIIKTKHKERSCARNIGWKKASGDIICFAEADSVFNKNWLKEIIGKFDEGADAVIDRRKVYKPSTFFQKAMEAQFNIRYTNYKPFSAWAFRKEILEKTKGFDEKLNQSEDSDLGKRILKLGHKILLADKAIQYHKGEPKNFMEYLNRTYISEKKRAKEYYKKYPKEQPIKKIIITLVFLLLPMISFLNYKFIIILFLFIFYISIFIKALVVERSWGIVKKRYLFSLICYRLIRNIFSVFGYLSGKLS